MTHGPFELTIALFFLFAAIDARRFPMFLRAAVIGASAIVFVGVGFWYVHGTPLYDFTAFYCGGNAVLHHADPYLAASLRECENAGLHNVPPVLPAPQPGYDMVLFALIALAPYVDANLLWIVLLGIALVTSIACLRRLTGLPAVSAFAFIALPIAYVSFVLGQLAPIVLALVCGCALAVREGRAMWAGTLAALTLIEPHIGLPVVIVTAIVLPAARLAIVSCGAALAVIAFATLGVDTNVAYLAHELPLHALAESGNADQYSLTMVTHLFGASDALADRLGMLQYLVMVAGGVTIGALASRRTGDRALAVLIAVAAVLFGGTFIHISEIALAIPAALLLGSMRSTPSRVFGIAAAFALTVIWDSTPFGQLFATCGLIVALAL